MDTGFDLEISRELFYNKITVVSWEYNLFTDSFDVFLSGCKPPHCEGCFNSELWEFGKGVTAQLFTSHFRTRISLFKEFINNISILGGEPLDNDIDDLVMLIKVLRTFSEPNVPDLKYWLYTRYLLFDIPKKVKDLFDYIKCGRFEINQTTEDNYQYGIKLASSNQNIYKRGVDFGF